MLILLILLSLFSGVSAQIPGSFIAQKKQLEINDLYAFNSYENGRTAFITIIANFAQDDTSNFANSFFDTNANYEINIDTDGDGVEEQTYRFEFSQSLKEFDVAAAVFPNTPSPFFNSGNLETDNGNISKAFQVELVRKKASYKLGNNGPNTINSGKQLRIEGIKDTRFTMPQNIAEAQSFTDYDAYSKNFIYDLDLRFRKCKETAKVFVGQRQASLPANLNGIRQNLDYDFTATNGTSTSANQSVLSIALELPKSCLDLPKDNSVIGVWTSIHYPARQINRASASFGKANTNSSKSFVQVNRMGHPFVTEYLIGYTDKISYSQTEARRDGKKFVNYFQYPALATLIGNNTSFTAPDAALLRTDLVEFYLSGIENLNQFTNSPKNPRNSNTLKLDTASTAVSTASQNTLGFIGSDNAGYPNGRRPGDDVIDIFFRVLMGNLLELADAPEKNTPFSDGVDFSATDFDDEFPYLNSPIL